MKQTLLTFCILLTSLAFGQITIGTGTNVDSNAGLTTPVSNFLSTSLSQFIYLASEINAQPGNITGLKFYLNNSTAITNSDDMVDIWLGHTTRSSYSPTVSSNGADWISISSHTQVLSSGTLVRTGNVISVTFTTPFNYNGIDNLVITVDANEPGSESSNTIMYYQTAPSANVVSLMFRTDNTLQNPLPLYPPQNFTGTVATNSTQAKYTRPIITLDGISVLSISDNAANNDISLFPNPADNELFVTTDKKIEEIKLYDSLGKLLETIPSPNNVIKTDNLQSGVYFLKMKMEDEKIICKKFVKK